MGAFDWACRAYREGTMFAAFDIETTGLDAQADRIVELGGVKFDRRGLAGSFSVLINPGIPMPPEAARVNGIYDDMLKDKPGIEGVLPDFLRFIRGCILTAHNASFDCGFINAGLKRHYRKDDAAQGSLLDGVEETGWAAPFGELPNGIVDTLAFAREAFPGRSTYKLQDLARTLNIHSGEAHRAMDDARVCMELFIACVSRCGEDNP
jgi:DNA polymerase-3 subunit epsilon